MISKVRNQERERMRKARINIEGQDIRALFLIIAMLTFLASCLLLSYSIVRNSPDRFLLSDLFCISNTPSYYYRPLLKYFLQILLGRIPLFPHFGAFFSTLLACCHAYVHFLDTMPVPLQTPPTFMLQQSSAAAALYFSCWLICRSNLG